MKTFPVQCETVDMSTGKTTKTETVDFKILPPSPTACPVCAVDPAHGAHEPHNAQSLYYQYAFRGEHGRWPTWKDAVAHCSLEMQAAWEKALRERGAWTQP